MHFRILLLSSALFLCVTTTPLSDVWSQEVHKKGEEFHINTHTSGNQEMPSVAAFPGGGFVVVWESDGQDGSSLGIYGQRFDGAGAGVGEEFHVNTHTADGQRWPARMVRMATALLACSMGSRTSIE